MDDQFSPSPVHRDNPKMVAQSAVKGRELLVGRTSLDRPQRGLIFLQHRCLDSFQVEWQFGIASKYAFFFCGGSPALLSMDGDPRRSAKISEIGPFHDCVFLQRYY